MARQGDVFPRRDLPGTSENWGRHVEDRIVLGERSEIQLFQKVDNGLLANEGQLATISNQLNDIYDQQLVLQQQQIDLQQQQQFLLTQVSSATQGSNTWSITVSPASTSTTTLLPFDPQYDVELTIDVPPSGEVRVDVVSTLYAYATSSATAWVRSRAHTPVEVISGGGSSILSVRPNLGVISSAAQGTSELQMPVQTFEVIQGLPPGEPCTFRSRREYRFTAASNSAGTSQHVSIFDTSLAVTKIA